MDYVLDATKQLLKFLIKAIHNHINKYNFDKHFYAVYVVIPLFRIIN